MLILTVSNAQSFTLFWDLTCFWGTIQFITKPSSKIGSLLANLLHVTIFNDYRFLSLVRKSWNKVPHKIYYYLFQNMKLVDLKTNIICTNFFNLKWFQKTTALAAWRL